MDGLHGELLRSRAGLSARKLAELRMWLHQFAQRRIGPLSRCEAVGGLYRGRPFTVASGHTSFREKGEEIVREKGNSATAYCCASGAVWGVPKRLAAGNPAAEKARAIWRPKFSDSEPYEHFLNTQMGKGGPLEGITNVEICEDGGGGRGNRPDVLERKMCLCWETNSSKSMSHAITPQPPPDEIETLIESNRQRVRR
jgi:hypothetical protein